MLLHGGRRSYAGRAQYSRRSNILETDRDIQRERERERGLLVCDRTSDDRRLAEWSTADKHFGPASSLVARRRRRTDRSSEPAGINARLSRGRVHAAVPCRSVHRRLTAGGADRGRRLLRTPIHAVRDGCIVGPPTITIGCSSSAFDVRSSGLLDGWPDGLELVKPEFHGSSFFVEL